MFYSPLKYENGDPYPIWGELVGWCLALSSMLCVPAIAIYLIAKEKGSFQQRITRLLEPKVSTAFNEALKVTSTFRFLPTSTKSDSTEKKKKYG